jgi:hypothetical protein
LPLLKVKWELSKLHLAASLLNFKKKKLKYLEGKEYIINGKNVLPTARQCQDALVDLMRSLEPENADQPPPLKKPQKSSPPAAFLADDESDSELSDSASASESPFKSEYDEIRRKKLMTSHVLLKYKISLP